MKLTWYVAVAEAPASEVGVCNFDDCRTNIGPDGRLRGTVATLAISVSKLSRIEIRACKEHRKALADSLRTATEALEGKS